MTASHKARLLVVALLFSVATAPLSAQGSPIGDLLRRARMALNDLRYAEADSLSRMVLSVWDTRLNRDQRVDALSVAAAARFPEPSEGTVQHADSALAAMRQIIRLDPDLRLRDDVTWPGLDSLFAIARTRTFSARAKPRSEATFGEGTVGVVAEGFSTRAARWRIDLIPVAGGPAIFTDTVTGTSANLALRLRILEGTPSIAAGSYLLRVTANDAASRDSLRWEFRAVAESAPLEFVPIQPTPDAARLLPEMAPPARRRGIATGVLLGGLTVVGTIVVRGLGDLSDAAETDSRAFAMGGLLAAGAIVAGFLDKGSPLEANRLANEQLVRDHAAEVEKARLENQRRLGAYRVTVRIQETP